MIFRIHDPYCQGDYIADDDDENLLFPAYLVAAQYACDAMYDSDYIDTFFSDNRIVFDPDDEDADTEARRKYCEFCHSESVRAVFESAISGMKPGDQITLYGVIIDAN